MTELDEYAKKRLEERYRGVTDKGLEEARQLAEKSFVANTKGGWHSLASADLNTARDIADEQTRRKSQFELVNYDEWGNWIGDPDKDPDRVKVPWWRSKEFWKKVASL